MSDSEAYPFGAVLKQFRVRAGISQEALAQRIDVHRNSIGGWERGNYLPAHADVLELVRALGLEGEDKDEFLRARYGHLPVEPPRASSLWNVPFARNRFFTNHRQLLSKMHSQFAQNYRSTLTQSLALTGLGGIGKTQAAIEYAYRYRSAYYAVCWVRAATHETLVADFVALAHLLELPGREVRDQTLIVAAVRRWFEQHSGWLLILDNADDLALLTDFLPVEGGGHIILTTRAQAIGRIASSLSVEKMGVAESMRLLLCRAKLLRLDRPLDSLPKAVHNQARQIVQALDGLPLALDQAGAYIEEVRCSLSQYRTLYEQSCLELLARRSSIDSSDYPYTVASTWTLSFERIVQADPVAAELLQLCAFLNPDAIPEAIVTKGVDDLGPVLGAVAIDPLRFNKAIEILLRYSLIKRDGDAKLLHLHRLVQLVVRGSLDLDAQRQWAERTIRMVGRAFPEVSLAAWPDCELYLPHARACAELMSKYSLSFPEATRLLHRAGIYSRDRGLYKQAEPLLQQALGIHKQELGAEHPETAAVLDDLGWLHCLHGKYEQAESLLRQALDIREQVVGSTHPETARSLNNLSWLYIQQSRYTQAEPLLQQALDIRERVLGTLHPETATSFNDLGWLYYLRGKYAQAKPLLQQALSTREQALGPDHPDVAESLNNLAILYYQRGEYTQAEQLLQQALSIREKALGPDHPDVAESLHNLASVESKQGKYEQAKPHYREALRIREQVLGPDHSITAFTLDTLGLFYQNQRKYKQAETLHKRALAIFERALGPEHPDTAIALQYLAKLYHAQGQYEQAQPLYERALGIFKHVFDPEHLRVAQCQHALAGLFTALGHYEQARPLYESALRVLEHSLGPEHLETINVRQDYDELLRIMQ
jgi:tetratricopeptide (TPR) repeat protein/transcriptional regulator with XRE-family HTH domain